MLPGRLCELAGQQQRAGAAGRQHTGQAQLAWPQLTLAPLHGRAESYAGSHFRGLQCTAGCMHDPTIIRRARAKGGDR